MQIISEQKTRRFRPQIRTSLQRFVLQENVQELHIQKDSLRKKEIEIERLTLQLNEVADECESRTRQLRELGTRVQSYEHEIEHIYDRLKLPTRHMRQRIA